MKTIYRILIILVVAMTVGGAIYGLVNINSTSSQPESTQLRERSAGLDTHAEFIPGSRPGRNGDEGGLSLSLGAIKNLAIIAIISVIYLNIGKRLGKRTPLSQDN